MVLDLQTTEVEKIRADCAGGSRVVIVRQFPRSIDRSFERAGLCRVKKVSSRGIDGGW